VKRESARAAPVWAGLRAIWLGLSRFQIVFLFSFRFKSALCLNLGGKLYAGPKIVKILGYVLCSEENTGKMLDFIF